MRPLIAALLAAFLFTGCAATGIREPEPVRTADEKTLVRALDEYNRFEGAVRMWGAASHDGGPDMDFGAGAEPGLGARFDAVAGPMSRLVFSAICREGKGCDVFIPDEFTVYRDHNPRMAAFFGALVTGRAAVLGPLHGAYVGRAGEKVLEFRRDGQWQKVVFSVDGTRPERIIYGEEGESASLEIKYSDFRDVGGRPFPADITFGGRYNGQAVRLRVAKVERVENLPGGVLVERYPPGVRIDGFSGRDSWKKLGMFWIPKD